VAVVNTTKVLTLTVDKVPYVFQLFKSNDFPKLKKESLSLIQLFTN